MYIYIYFNDFLIDFFIFLYFLMDKRQKKKKDTASVPAVVCLATIDGGVVATGRATLYCCLGWWNH